MMEQSVLTERPEPGEPRLDWGTMPREAALIELELLLQATGSAGALTRAVAGEKIDDADRLALGRLVSAAVEPFRLEPPVLLWPQDRVRVDPAVADRLADLG